MKIDLCTCMYKSECNDTVMFLGQLSGQGMTYAEFMKRTSGQSRCPTLTRTDFRQTDWKTWEAEQFIDGIFR